MKVEIIRDTSYEKPKVIIYTNEVTEEVERLVRNILKLTTEEPLLGKSVTDENIHLLYPKDIIKIYANSQKVFVMTDQDEFQVKGRLYQWEERLGTLDFIRISKSEIINKLKIVKLDLNIHGTICVFLKGDLKAYVSRRYIKNIKETLGI